MDWIVYMRMFQSQVMMYDTLANYYDELVKDDEATKAWVSWIEAFVKTGSLLDLACGSAEITIALAKDGFKVSGLDLSEQMIDHAKAKEGAASLDLRVGNMLDLSKLGQFDSISCLCDSFNYLLDKADVETFFKEVHDHLTVGGHFFMDMHSMDRLIEFEEPFNETGHFDDCDYQWEINSEDDYIYQEFAFYPENGNMILERHIQRVYDPAWIKELLSKYFDVISVRTDFELEGVQEGEKIFYVCQKREDK